MVLNKKELLQHFQRFPVINRTWCYLFGALKLQNQELFIRLVSLENSLIGTYLDDAGFAYQYIREKPVIFVALDTSVNSHWVNSCVAFAAEQPEFIMIYDYYYDPSIKILVLELNEIVYTKFLQGQYSKMYNDSELNRGISEMPLSIEVFKRSNLAKTQFTKLLNITFDTVISPEELEEDAEYELPPIYSNESKFLETITYE